MISGVTPKPRVTSETALHLSKGHYWIPEINLMVFDLADLGKDEQVIWPRDKGMIITSEGHEQAHSFLGRTGAVYNRMAWFISGEEFLLKIEEPNYELSMINQIASDIMHMQSESLMESYVCYYTTLSLDYLNSHPELKYDEELKTYIEVSRDNTLERNTEIRKLYDRMMELKEWANSEYFVWEIVSFSLDVPYIFPSPSMLSRPLNVNPIFRFEEISNAIEELNKTKPLKERSVFSDMIAEGSMVEPVYEKRPTVPITKSEIYNKLRELTSFPYGDINFSDELYKYFTMIQYWHNDDPWKDLKPADQETIKELEKNIDEKLGKGFKDVFLSRNRNYNHVLYKANNWYYFIPNVWCLPSDCLNDWMYTYLYWEAKNAILTNDDKDNLLSLAKIFMSDNDYQWFESKVNQAYEKMDWSKIKPSVLDEFKETSKNLGRKLNWS